MLAQDTNEDGIIIPQNDLDQAYRTAVPMSHFEKCSGCSKERLQPGEMKTVKISFNFDGKLFQLMDSFMLEIQIHTSKMGTLIMFAFEKVMRIEANVISINWPENYVHGARVTC